MNSQLCPIALINGRSLTAELALMKEMQFLERSGGRVPESNASAVADKELSLLPETEKILNLLSMTG